MKIERTRASRKAAHSARRYHVSPVTRAIRNVLTVSAAALAFSGTGLVLAKTPATPQALVAPRNALEHAPFAFKTDVPVIDLTIVRDIRIPASVVDGEFDLRAVFGGQPETFTTLASTDGDVDTAFAMVADPTIVALVTTTDGSDAYEWNGTTINATAYRAAGLFAHAQNGGDAMVHNDGTITADGTFAYGAWARADSGDATAINHGPITATGALGATGVLAGGTGTSYAVNESDIIATSTSGFAAGVWAYGDHASAVNWYGDVSTYGNTVAVGIDADGGAYAEAVNRGTVVASAGGRALGMYAAADGVSGVATVENYGDVSASSVNGYATGLYSASLYRAQVQNRGDVTATSQNSEAHGIFAAGDIVGVGNNGSLTATGYTVGAGIVAFANAFDVTSDGTIDATATAVDGWAVGILGRGGNMAVTNATGGSITANGFLANGIELVGTGQVFGMNDGSIHAYGEFASGMLVTNTGDGGLASASNRGDITAIGGTFASGIEAVARAYHGTASVDNSGSIYAAAKYGNVQGVVAAADLGASVTNAGDITAYGGTSAYGALVLSADGDTVVNNTIDGSILAYANHRGAGTAYGIAMQTNNGLASVTNDGFIGAIGYAQAMGVYASTKWNDVEIRNNGTLIAYSAGAATGAIGITYTGDATVVNDGIANVSGFTAGGIRGISLYGDSEVVNRGDVSTYGYYLDRGLTSRALYGGTASIDNAGNVGTDGGVSSYGAWARADFGNAVVTNSGSIATSSVYYGVGVLAGGYVGSSVTNGATGVIGAFGANDAGIGVLAYSNGGNTTVDNTGYIRGSSYADASGVQAFAYNAATVLNNAGGQIAATAMYGDAIGMLVDGYTADVLNEGSVSALGYTSATGIQAQGYLSASVLTTGSVSAYAYGEAYGVFAIAGDTSSIRNDGDITATSVWSDAIGELAVADLTAITTNGGAIVVDAMNGNATGALGAAADVDMTNDGTIVADGYYSASGMTGFGVNHSILINHGDIAVNAVNGYAFGLYTYAEGYARANNNGGITAFADNGAAYGVYAAGDLTVVRNSATGTIDAGANSGLAMGVYAWGNVGATIENDGDVKANAVNGSAYGLGAISNGDAAIVNNGGVDVVANGDATGLFADGYASANITNGGAAIVTAVSNTGSATGAYAVGTLVDVDNAGSISATANRVGIAIEAHAWNTYGDSTATIVNSGSLYAHGTGKYLAAGILATSGGDANVTSTGAIEASGGRDAYGILVYANGSAHVVNGGDIDASAMAIYGRAIGIYAGAQDGDVAIDSTGNITAAGKYAIGISASAGAGSASVTNAGAITVSPTGLGGVGILAESDDGDASVVNAAAGTIGIHSDYAGTMGVVATTAGHASVDNAGTIESTSVHRMAGGIYAGGDIVDVANGGTVAVSGGESAVGIAVDAYTAATISNGGTITVAQTGDYVAAPTIDAEPGTAVGIAAYIYDGSLAISNDGGTIDVTGHGTATGIQAGGFGTLSVSGDGAIAATSTYGDATGIDVRGGDEYGIAGTIDITVGGSIAVGSGAGAARGIFAAGSTVGVQNAAMIDSHGTTFSTGIHAVGDAVTVGNDGAITATITGADFDAVGIDAYGAASLAVANGGDILATADDMAIGIVGYSYGGTVDVSSTGSIVATAGVGAVGLHAMADDGDLTVSNGGDITATATTHATGALLFAGHASFANDGHVLATATGATGIASGVHVVGDDVAFANNGDIAAIATGGEATGAAASGYALAVTNGGTISAETVGDGQAMGLVAMGDALSFDNAGSITANAVNGAAVGAYVATNVGNATLANGGTIDAHSDGGETIGLLAHSAGDIALENGGTLSATNAIQAVALSLDAAGTSVVQNTGTIVAYSNAEGSIAIEGGDGVEDLRNGGTIAGALLTYGGDDLLTNQDGGTWVVLGTGTDFGAGDDNIVNEAGGTIVLHDAGISLGSSSPLGNRFGNAGTIGVLGSSFIDMGTGEEALAVAPNAAPIAVLNPLSFHNDGTISFLDGAPDDVLSIAGDFAGEGALNVDVSLLNGLSDMLYIDGNIVDGSVQSVNVNVLDIAPTGQGIDIPVVVVAGESTEDNVVAGTFNIDNVLFSASNFLDLKVAITQKLAADGAGMFALTFDFEGINDTGVLASSIAAGAHSLMDAQVGTFRQRMGVFSQLGNGDKGAWVRVFSDKGTVDPSVALYNLPANRDFTFDQTNTGIEAGVNALVTDGVFVGLSLGTAQGKQTLASRGFGSDEIDGDTIGAYVTWLSPDGFYADFSYRWMHFDGDLKTLGGVRNIGGDADALNLEAGWNIWTSAGGLMVVPQVQYTRSEVQNIDRISGDLVDFVSDGGTSSRGRVGIEFQQTFKGDTATWTPYGSISAIREFDGETSFAIGDGFGGTTSTEGTSAMVEFGANAAIGRWNVFGGVNWTDGGALDSFVGGQLGVRYTW